MARKLLSLLSVARAACLCSGVPFSITDFKIKPGKMQKITDKRAWFPPQKAAVDSPKSLF